MAKTRSGTRQHLAETRKPRLCIHDLPQELLTLIFEDVGLAEPQILVAVTLVCEAWRDIIYTSPNFWVSLNCRAHVPQGHNQNLVEFVQRWFDRSNDLPLSLRIDMCPPRPSAVELNDFTQYLLRTKRWKNLEFNLVLDSKKPGPNLSWPWMKTLFHTAFTFPKQPGQGPCWEALESLDIISRDLTLYSPAEMPHLALKYVAPNLQNLRVAFRRFSSIGYFSAMYINMHNLKKLDIDGDIEWLSPNELLTFYFRIISQATQLEELKLLDYYSKRAVPTSFEFAALPVLNATLKSLTLHDSPAVRFFLRNVTLPSLASLTITKQESLTIISETYAFRLDESIRQLLTHSECKLRTFTLENAYISRDGLVGLLPSMQTVDTLILNANFSSCTEAIAFLSTLQEETGREGEGGAKAALPALKSISFTVGAWITPATKLRLRDIFRAVVDDPRRWYPTRASQTDNEAKTMETGRGLARLENAQLVLHHIDGASSTLLTRGRKVVG